MCEGAQLLTLSNASFVSLSLSLCVCLQAKYQKHRRIIVDWMCEVGEEYKLCALTIHNAVRYLDRVLGGGVDVAKNQLQLVAMACVLVASKVRKDDKQICRESNMMPTCASSTSVLRVAA